MLEDQDLKENPAHRASKVRIVAPKEQFREPNGILKCIWKLTNSFIDLGAQGPQGVKGDVGPAGIQGPQGMNSWASTMREFKVSIRISFNLVLSMLFAMTFLTYPNKWNRK